MLFASGFENGFEGWDAYNQEASEIIMHPDSAFSGNNVLKMTATRGENTGGDVTHFIKPEQTHVYLRFYTKLHKNTITPHHFVKIYADPLNGGGPPGEAPSGDKAFWTGIEPLKDNTWNFYTYWHEMNSWQTAEGTPDGRDNPYYGNTFKVPNQKPFKKGEWICVEAMVKANTPGKHDGEQAFYINGEKIGHWKEGEPYGEWYGDRFRMDGDKEKLKPFEGFNWRTIDAVKINKIILRWYISSDHMTKATHDLNSVYFDNIVIATEYIGPMHDKNGHVLIKE